MSLDSSGIVFTPPSIPQVNSLHKIGAETDIQGIRQIGRNDCFPPLTLKQIVQVIRNDNAEAITLNEWLMLFSSKLDFDGSIDQELCILIWKAINQFDVVSNMAFFLASQFLENERSSYPEFLIDTMEAALPFLSQKHHSRLIWLISVSNKNYIECNKQAAKAKITSLGYINFLALSKPSRTRNKLIDNLVLSIEDNLNQENINWLFGNFSDLTKPECIRVSNLFICSKALVHQSSKYWVENKLLPGKENSFWYELSPNSRRILKRTFEISNYFILDILIKQLASKEVQSELKISPESALNLESRSNFWSNYSQSFGRIKLLIPHDSYKVFGEKLHLEKSEFVILPSIPGEDSEAVIFESEQYIVVEILRGIASEVRIFEHSERNIERLLKNDKLTLSSIRNMSYGAVHDHEYLWQFSLEKLLRKKLEIKPNKDTIHFNGLSKKSGEYSFEFGLPTPSSDKLQRRQERLIEWNERFWSQEEKTDKLKDLPSLMRKSFRDLAIAKNALMDGNKAVYEEYMHRSANKGNPEAMYLLGVNIINKPTSTESLKKDGENWISKSASNGYEPAVELAKKYGISIKGSSTTSYKSRVANDKNLIRAIRSNKKNV